MKLLPLTLLLLVFGCANISPITFDITDRNGKVVGKGELVEVRTHIWAKTHAFYTVDIDPKSTVKFLPLDADEGLIAGMIPGAISGIAKDIPIAIPVW